MHKLIVHNAYWASTFADDAPIGLPFPPNAIDTANAHLRWMHEEIVRILPNVWHLKIPSRLLRADRAHRWGVSPFHYISKYYEFALAELRRRLECLGKTGA